MTDAGPEVTFAGLGRKGVPMARNLIAGGCRVHGHDISESAREREVATPLGAQAAQIYGLLDLAGMPDLDFSAGIRFLAGRGRSGATD